MALEIIALEPGSAQSPGIQRAAEALQRGALVAFPTETVYGLAANAAIEESVKRLCEVKGRAGTQPFTVHIGNRADCDQFVPEFTPIARRLIKKGWPGPLTLVFPVPDPTQARVFSTLSEAGASSIYSQYAVGVRFPDHPQAAAFLAQASVPVIASSANFAGHAPPTEADSIRQNLGEKIDVLLDAGPCRYRQASTIVALNGHGYRVIRQGVYDERTVRRLATLNILFVCSGNTCRSPMAEGLCRQFLSEKLGCKEADLATHGIVIGSAGTGAMSGHSVSTEAVEVCRRRGIDISGHVSRTLTVDLIHPADYIFTMAAQHFEAVRGMSPQDAAKAIPLDPEDDITDPVGGTIEDYERTAERIAKALRIRLEEVPL